MRSGLCKSILPSRGGGQVSLLISFELLRFEGGGMSLRSFPCGDEMLLKGGLFGGGGSYLCSCGVFPCFIISKIFSDNVVG
jgi:hypothetical protein